MIQSDLEGKVLDSWGEIGSRPGQFNLAHGITLDSAGNLYVSEIRGQRVQKFVREP